MRLSFLLKIAATVGLVLLFHGLFPDGFEGARVGGLAAVWLVLLVAVRRDVARSRRAWVALGGAAVFAGMLVDDPGPLPWVLFWAALSVAALIPRVAAFDDAWRWAMRLLVQGLSTPFALPFDLRRMGGVRGRGLSPVRIAATLALPVIGGTLFLVLFAQANPLIENVFYNVALPEPWQLGLWAAVAAMAWPAFRPRAAAIRWAARLPDPEPRIPGTSLPSVLLALGLFNLLFAVQNALDIAFLWSGAGLPEGVSAADYAHRGAYPLIATALLAGVLALAMLRPGSESAGNRWARRLVTLWVAQNLVLVASSVLRTTRYIDESMLTAWRIAALLWMGLVALGLVLIAWRILGDRSARWLVNANALAAGIVLTGCAAVDLGATAAAFNVDAQRPEAVDLCYLRHVGDGALLPMIKLEQRPMDAATRERVRFIRQTLFADLLWRQTHWGSWTPRGARRLSAARAALGREVARPVDPRLRFCDGSLPEQVQS
ncbi:DUF4173 domain-containing protein [uncultured Sphingomonas sp.]|uniref:DUF4153 domain-containing protein n=1 Tax=uncultured Sphingomonas sp. TaxID=158754 RepID=UPI0025FC3E5E|nr:DUF4173 domain-containing protein [uncultured Sphingomonas sp.]